MLIPTHLLIGTQINKSIKENLNFKLHTESFLYGNIKPDISPKLILLPHYKKDSFEKIIEMIETTQAYKINNNKNLKAFSAKLGIINHYLADYFCFAHNDAATDRFKAHLIYENRLAIQFIRTDLNKLCKKCLASNYSFTNIKEFIDNKHVEYLNSKNNIKTDIQFSIDVCTSVTYKIVNSHLNHISINIA